MIATLAWYGKHTTAVRQTFRILDRIRTDLAPLEEHAREYPKSPPSPDMAARTARANATAARFHFLAMAKMWDVAAGACIVFAVLSGVLALTSITQPGAISPVIWVGAAVWSTAGWLIARTAALGIRFAASGE